MLQPRQQFSRKYSISTTGLLLLCAFGFTNPATAQNFNTVGELSSFAEVPADAIPGQSGVNGVASTVPPGAPPVPQHTAAPGIKGDTPVAPPAIGAPSPQPGRAEVPGPTAVIVIDMDEDASQARAPIWKDLPDAPDRSHISKGTEFPVSCISSLTSKTAKEGDPIEARLKVDLKIGGELIAPKGSLVRGHVTSAYPARRLLAAEIGLKRWMKASGALGLQFDEIINHKNEHVPLEAIPARHARIINNKNTGRVLGVNGQGQIASPLSVQLKHQGVHMAVRGAAAVGGVFTMGAVPVVFGAIGAIDPSFAFMHPVGKNVHHRRLKGFGMGVISGLPGGFILADFLIRGVESQIRPGDEFLVCLKQDFTGRKSTSAELMPYPHTRLRGEILLKPTKKGKRTNVNQ
ncbi:MAG: hypothetical protein K2W95_19220 [Candidatus Obscuribacterales bacterium]|nr:hypothetical protein [Candidatus Obscuribacterales bacterium]